MKTPDCPPTARRPLCVVVHDAVAADAPPDALDALVQAEAVGAALGRLGWRIETLAFDLDLGQATAELRRREPDLVFNLVEAPGGKGRLIGLAPDLFEALDLLYTGASAEAIVATSNKLRAKRRLAAMGLPTPRSFPGDGPAGPADLAIVKSAWEHASIGLDQGSVVRADRAAKLIARRERQHGGNWFAEGFVDGREFNVALLGPAAEPVVLPPAEIVFDGLSEGQHRIVDYAAKWRPDSPEYRATTRSFAPAADPELSRRLSDLARACWDAFELSGYARVDLRMDAEERLWILEVNANPCLAPDAGFAAAAAQAGLGYDAMIQRVVVAVPGAAHLVGIHGMGAVA